MQAEVLFTRAGSVADLVSRALEAATTSVDAALYRLNLPRLARELERARERGLRVRLVLDRGKFEETRSTRELLANSRLDFRLLHGRQGPGSKLHHKFVILDTQTVLTGSYNWTVESEEENYDNLVILRGLQVAQEYMREFEALWAEGLGVRN